MNKLNIFTILSLSTEDLTRKIEEVNRSWKTELREVRSKGNKTLSI